MSWRWRRWLAGSSRRPDLVSSKVRIAVAGAGRIGQAHIQRIIAEPQAEPRRDRRPLACRPGSRRPRLDVPWFADLEDGLAARRRPDGVVIATPKPAARARTASPPSRPACRCSWRSRSPTTSPAPCAWSRPPKPPACRSWSAIIAATAPLIQAGPRHRRAPAALAGSRP